MIQKTLAIALTLTLPTLASCAAAPRDERTTVTGRAPGEPHAKEEPRMTLENHKALATAVVVELFNERKYERATSYVAADFRSHNPQVQPGIDGIQTFVKRFIAGFSDFHGEIQHTIAEGDKVMIWVRWQGTHTGTFAGVPATGNKVAFDTVEVFRVANDKLVEHWDIADRSTLEAALRGR